MLTKTEYDEAKIICGSSIGLTVRDVFIDRLIAEYESANPPKHAVTCPACGGEMSINHPKDNWYCTAQCGVRGPYGDLDGSRVMALKQKKLPLKPPFVVLAKRAWPIIGFSVPQLGDVWLSEGAQPCSYATKGRYPILGKPVDVKEWME